MDEEQPQKKITLNNFFEQIVEIDKVANAALTNSNMVQSQLNAVQLDLKRLVESLQVNFDSGVQTVQNQINEVTNVIVQEQTIKQSETDALEEQIFAQEDKLQKQVKGKKSTSSDGNLIQKAMSSVKDKAKSNLLATGLFGASFLLAGLKGNRPESNKDKDKEKNNQEGDKSLGFTGFTEENVGDNAFGFGSPFDTDLGIGDDAFGFGSPFDTDLGIGDDAFGFGSFDTTEIINNVNESREQQLLLTLEERGNKIEDMLELNKQLYLEKDVSSMTDELNTIKESTNNLKLNKKDNKFGGNDYLQKLIKDKTNIEPILNNESISGDLTTITVDGKKYPRGLGGLGYNPFGPEGGSTYGDSRYDPYSFINDNNSNGGKVIDGGTTIIEGNNEVVNEDISTGQGRGEVVVDVSIVKSSNSPVSAVAIAEGNSLNHLTI
tara:strand:- start:1399 stop:2703 length:1305 start_codon:yes stop_codon:yes gene_type:complete